MVPAIYLPTTLDSSLGIATADEFAGNDYYYKEPTCHIVVKRWGNNPAAIVEAANKRRGFNQREDILFYADNVATMLISFCPLKEAQDFQQWASQSGTTVDVVLPEGQTAQEMTQVPVSKFFNKHIARFINTILNYGAKDTGRR